MTTEFSSREALIARTLNKLSKKQIEEYQDILRFAVHNVNEAETIESLAQLESQQLTGYLESVRKELAVAY